MRCVIDSAERVRHRVSDAEADVGVSHGGDVLGERHAFASVRIVSNSFAEVLADELDCLKVKAVGELPGSRGGVAFDRVGQRVHTGGSGQALRHRGHHIRVDNRDVRDIVGVDADEFSLSLHVGDDIVDGGLGACAAGRRDRDREDGAVLRRSNALKGADIRKFRVVDDNADAFAGVHGGAAADGDHEISAGLFVSGNAVLDVLDRRVRLDIGIQGVRNAVLLEKIRDLCGDAELDEVRVGSDECLCEALRLDDARDLINRTVAMVRDAV